MTSLFYISDSNNPRVPVMVNAVIITSSLATIQWSFPRLLEMRNEIISIFYGTILLNNWELSFTQYLVILI